MLTPADPGFAPDAATLGRETRDSEVAAVAQRRRFTREYKLRILREADRCRQLGERDIEQLKKRLEQAEAIIEVQKNSPRCWA